MTRIVSAVTLMSLMLFSPFSPSAQAGPEPYIGEIMMFGGNFCPRGWGNADGQLLPVSQNQALFSILGTTYGGDGRTTFALPDMRGRVAIHVGQGPGLSNRQNGSKGGAETHTLNVSELPSHSHSLQATNNSGSSRKPEGKVPAKTRKKAYGSAGSTQMAPQAVSSVGGGQPHNNMQPFLTIRYCMALQGLYPSRN